jgi:hypothetical protein
MKTEKYIGYIEIEASDGEFRVWEVVKRGDTLVVGTACNVGLLESFSMQLEDDESLDEALGELYADLVLEADGEGAYMARLS